MVFYQSYSYNSIFFKGVFVYVISGFSAIASFANAIGHCNRETHNKGLEWGVYETPAHCSG